MDMVEGAYSTALFHSIGKHVGLGDADETVLFWRVKRPTLYLGYHQYVADEAYESYCSDNHVDIVRRILGGGCGYCDSNQVLFAVIGKDGGTIPGSVQAAYRKVLKGVVLALSKLGLDSELDPERNGVFVDGRKISGNAQGRFDGSVMVNGSLLLDFDFETMDKVLRHPTKNLRPHLRTAREGMITLFELMDTPPEPGHVKKALHSGFEDALGIDTYRGHISDSEHRLAEELLKQYTSRQWTYRMDIKREKRNKVK